MGELRKVFFVFAVIAIVLALLLEIGSSLFPKSDPEKDAVAKAVAGAGIDAGDIDPKSVEANSAPPGLAIRYLAFLDGLLVFTMALMTLSMLLPERIHGRIQGIITLIVSLLTGIGSVLAILLIALPLLLVMFGLFVAVPFGTIAYLAVWGFFDQSSAAAILGILLFLKLAFGILLILAHQRFLQNKGLVLMILTSLLANVIISLLHGFVPGILVSITDAIAAIVVGILALIWAIVLFIGSILSVLKAISSAV
jgi:hypothetical protein